MWAVIAPEEQYYNPKLWISLECERCLRAASAGEWTGNRSENLHWGRIKCSLLAHF